MPRTLGSRHGVRPGDIGSWPSDFWDARPLLDVSRRSAMRSRTSDDVVGKSDSGRLMGGREQSYGNDSESATYRRQEQCQEGPQRQELKEKARREGFDTIPISIIYFFFWAIDETGERCDGGLLGLTESPRQRGVSARGFWRWLLGQREKKRASQQHGNRGIVRASKDTLEQLGDLGPQQQQQKKKCVRGGSRDISRKERETHTSHFYLPDIDLASSLSLWQLPASSSPRPHNQPTAALVISKTRKPRRSPSSKYCSDLALLILRESQRPNSHLPSAIAPNSPLILIFIDLPSNSSREGLAS